MEHLVITVNREYGSGGRLVGEKLALELGFLYYDKKIITLASEKSGLSKDFIERSEERATSSFLYNLSTNFTFATNMYSMPNVYSQYDMPINNKAYYAQASVIQEIAGKHSSVIVGRCANYVLRDRPNCVRLFIYADMEDKIKRSVEVYKVDPNKAEEIIVKTDKGRANYYRHHTGEIWGNMRDFDLCINTSSCGIDGAVRTIKDFLKESGKL